MLKVYAPPFKIDLETVGVESGDYDLAEAGKIVGQPRVNRAVVDLYQQAGAPAAIAFASDPGHLKVLTAMFRIARIRAAEVADHADVEVCRTRVAGLSDGEVDVLVTGRRLAGTSPIPKLGAVILARPTLNPATHARFLFRLDRTLAELIIIDVVDGCRKHGALGMTPEVIIGAATEVITDPVVERLTEIPHRVALEWCGRNVARIELLQRAKGRKDGWSYHVIEAVRGKAAAENWWRQRGGK